MPYHEFGIMENVEENREYVEYEPEKYNCIYVHDDIVENFFPKIEEMKSFFHNTNRPDFGLAYCGITLIPPQSLSVFQKVILSLKEYEYDNSLQVLNELILEAAWENKFIIHFGI